MAGSRDRGSGRGIWGPLPVPEVVTTFHSHDRSVRPGLPQFTPYRGGARSPTFPLDNIAGAASGSTEPNGRREAGRRVLWSTSCARLGRMNDPPHVILLLTGSAATVCRRALLPRRGLSHARTHCPLPGSRRGIGARGGRDCSGSWRRAGVGTMQLRSPVCSVTYRPARAPAPDREPSSPTAPSARRAGSGRDRRRGRPGVAPVATP